MVAALSGHPLEILQIKSAAVLAAIFISWIILKWIVRVIERRLIKYTFIQENRKIFSAIEKLGSYALVLMAGTYFIQLFDIQAVAKPFYALLIILVATPVKDFLLVENGPQNGARPLKSKNSMLPKHRHMGCLSRGNGLECWRCVLRFQFW